MNSQSLFVKSGDRRKKVIDERLTGKHVQALASLQATCNENHELRHRVSELEGYKLRADYYATVEQQVQSLKDELSKCDTLHSLGRYTEEKINEIRKKHSKSLQDYKEIMEKRYKNQLDSYTAEQEEKNKAWKDEKIQMKKIEEELRASNKVLQTKAEAATTMEKNTNNLVEELEQAMASFEEIKARNEELQESRNNLEQLCTSMEGENFRLQEELHNVSYDKRKLKKDMNKMVVKITKYVKKIKELEQFQNTVSRLEFENSWTKHLHDKTLTDFKSLQLRHRDVVSELQTITEERNLLSNELSTVQREVTQLKDELKNSKPSFMEFLELKRQVAALQEENKSLSKKSRYKLKMLKPDTAMLEAEASSDRQLVPVQKVKAIQSS